jgi:hypothetical protein
MPSDPHYKSQNWKKLRARRLAMDGYRCIVPGCGQRATTVDHIKRRRDSGADTLENTRSLCDEHDRSIKEMSDGRRRNGGKLIVKGASRTARRVILIILGTWAALSNEQPTPCHSRSTPLLATPG